MTDRRRHCRDPRRRERSRGCTPKALRHVLVAGRRRLRRRGARGARVLRRLGVLPRAARRRAATCRSTRWLRPSGPVGLTLGIAGVIAMLCTLPYALRKRWRRLSQLGTDSRLARNPHLLRRRRSGARHVPHVVQVQRPDLGRLLADGARLDVRASSAATSTSAFPRRSAASSCLARTSIAASGQRCANGSTTLPPGPRARRAGGVRAHDAAPATGRGPGVARPLLRRTARARPAARCCGATCAGRRRCGPRRRRWRRGARLGARRDRPAARAPASARATLFELWHVFHRPLVFGLFAIVARARRRRAVLRLWAVSGG